MRCPLCQARPVRRQCPALERKICSACCGTKRRVEIRCPDTCAYLANAQINPPATVRKQEAHDLALIVPGLKGLSEAQQQLFLSALPLVDRFKGEGLDAAVDEDVADAAGALAATYETAARGVIYEHRAGTAPARRIAGEMKTAFEAIGRDRTSGFATEAAQVLRRLEERVREVHAAGGDRRRGFLDLASRVAVLLAQTGSGGGGSVDSTRPSSLIVP
jgi:hypothetical protein